MAHGKNIRSVPKLIADNIRAYIIQLARERDDSEAAIETASATRLAGQELKQQDDSGQVHGVSRVPR